jgi:hypothetical protein
VATRLAERLPGDSQTRSGEQTLITPLTQAAVGPPTSRTVVRPRIRRPRSVAASVSVCRRNG